MEDLTPREIQGIISQAKKLLATDHGTTIEQSLSLVQSFSFKTKTFFYDSKKGKWKTGRILMALSLTGSILYAIYKLVERYDISAKEKFQQNLELNKLAIEADRVKAADMVSIITAETRKIVEERLLQESKNEAARIIQNEIKTAAEAHALKVGADAAMKNAENTAGAIVRDVAESVQKDLSRPITESTTKQLGVAAAAGALTASCIIS